MTVEEILFYIVILLANIIQGITGFAGTILAMPFGLMTVGYDVAKPVLNVLGLLSGIYVFVGNWRKVQWKEVGKIVLFMAIGMAGGFAIKHFLGDRTGILYKVLAAFVLFLAIQGLVKILLAAKKKTKTEREPLAKGIPILLGAGVAHGIFVSGGPLLIGYLAKKLHKKDIFRATISTVWIILNSMILAEDLISGTWNTSLIRPQLISLVPLFAGMFIGSKLVKIMSQKVFMIITYVLLFISGIILMFK